MRATSLYAPGRANNRPSVAGRLRYELLRADPAARNVDRLLNAENCCLNK